MPNEAITANTNILDDLNCQLVFNIFRRATIKGSPEEREPGSPGAVHLLQESLPGQEVQEPEGHDESKVILARVET